jgi:hypothetical protein
MVQLLLLFASRFQPTTVRHSVGDWVSIPLDIRLLPAPQGQKNSRCFRSIGNKISNPTVLARIEHEELEQLLRGCGWTPHFVEGDEPDSMHQLMAATLEEVIDAIRQI